MRHVEIHRCRQCGAVAQLGDSCEHDFETNYELVEVVLVDAEYYKESVPSGMQAEVDRVHVDHQAALERIKLLEDENAELRLRNDDIIILRETSQGAAAQLARARNAARGDSDSALDEVRSALGV